MVCAKVQSERRNGHTNFGLGFDWHIEKKKNEWMHYRHHRQRRSKKANLGIWGGGVITSVVSIPEDEGQPDSRLFSFLFIFYISSFFFFSLAAAAPGWRWYWSASVAVPTPSPARVEHK
jgi:hypothetical protein